MLDRRAFLKTLGLGAAAALISSPVLAAARKAEKSAPAAAATDAAAPAAAPAVPADVGPRDSFDLYLLVGQSNMAGRGAVAAEDKTPHPRVFKFTKDGTWAPATAPLHFDKPGAAGVGPGDGFGRAMAEKFPAVRIGLIPAAVGGTGITKWEPGVKDGTTKTVPYDDAIARAKAAMKSGRLKGILWHQGEADSGEPNATAYAERLTALVARFRKDLDAPDVPFVAGALGDFTVAKNEAKGNHGARKVNETLAALTKTIKNYAFVSSEGLKEKGDNTHFDAAGARELGRRFAEAMAKLVK